MAHLATQTSRKQFTVADEAGELVIASGSTVKVFGMIFTTGGTAITFTITDGTDTYFTIRVNTNQSLEITTPWLADKGVRVRAGVVNGNPSAVVFHGNPGA